MSAAAFGKTACGANASLFSIAHSSGIRAAVTDLGATLVSLEVPDRSGRMGDVVLGFSRAEDYAAHADYYFGSTVGRFGNRFAHGRFELGGRPYQLTTNNSPGGLPCHLHGGVVGFHRNLWSLEDAGEDYVRFVYCSPNGEEGYPGNLRTTVTYRVGLGRQLSWTAEAVSNAPTIVNLVHHPYWNLSGGESPTIDGHVLQLFADSYLPVTDGKIPPAKSDFWRERRWTFANRAPCEEKKVWPTTTVGCLISLWRTISFWRHAYPTLEAAGYWRS